MEILPSPLGEGVGKADGRGAFALLPAILRPRGGHLPYVTLSGAASGKASRAVERVSFCHFDREGLKARRAEKSCAVAYRQTNAFLLCLHPF